MTDLQSRCEEGQRQLMEMRYLEAESTLAAAERDAWAGRDFDTLARLYMPLQETRRQRRQTCGEGIVRLDLLASSDAEQPDPQDICRDFPHGQLLVAGWGSIAPAVRVRGLQSERGLFVDTFLAAAYPMVGGNRAVVVVPLEGLALPPVEPGNIDGLLANLPPHCLVFHENELPRGSRLGTFETYGQVMAMWEKLHAPYLAAADMQIDPLKKIEHYRKTIEVDYACELAHQKLSDVAKQLAQARR